MATSNSRSSLAEETVTSNWPRRFESPGSKTKHNETSNEQSHQIRSRHSNSNKSQPQRIRSCHEDSGCLEVTGIPQKDNTSVVFHKVTNSKDRSSSSSSSSVKAKKAPPVKLQRVDSATRRVTTPTKQIVLEAAKRKTESFLPFECFTSNNQSSDAMSCKQINSRVNDYSTKMADKEQDKKIRCQHEKNSEEKDEEEDEDSSSSSSSSSEEEPIKAPNQLMMEFLDCVMCQDFENAMKLCTMILLYEPENTEALNFKFLMEERNALNAEDSEDNDEDDDDDDDDNEDDDDDDDDSDEESEESEFEEEEEEKEEEEERKKKEKNASSV